MMGSACRDFTLSIGTPRHIARGGQIGTFSKMKGKADSDGVLSTKENNNHILTPL